MSGRLKVWNEAESRWEYVSGTSQPLLRYVPLNPTIRGPNIGGTSSTSANTGVLTTPVHTGIPPDAVAVSLHMLAAHSVATNAHRYNVFNYGQATYAAQMMSGKIANGYESLTTPFVVLGGDRQFDYEIVIGAAGTTTYWYDILGYWTYAAATEPYQTLTVGYGTTFPVSPNAGDRFFRTDLGMEFFWNGTYWLSTTLYHFTSGVGDAVWNPAISADTVMERGAVPLLSGGSDIWLEDMQAGCFINSGGTALSASHKWTVSLGFGRDNTALTYDTKGTVVFDSGSSNVPRMGSSAMDTLMNNGTTHGIIAVTWLKVGTPGSLRIGGVTFSYRIVAS